MPLFRHHPGRLGKTPGLCRRCLEVPHPISPGAGYDPRDGTGEIGRQGRPGQDPGEERPGSACLREVAAKAEKIKPWLHLSEREHTLSYPSGYPALCVVTHPIGQRRFSSAMPHPPSASSDPDIIISAIVYGLLSAG